MNTEIKTKVHAISWFEIPVVDFERAKRFYAEIVGSELHDMSAPDMKMAAFPSDMEQGGVGGAIIEAKDYLPTATGSTIYLDGGANLQTMLDKVPTAGGKITTPKTAIGGNMGHFALFLDTEGNRVGLWSMG
jgi:predicted enzyme related to lactoylglutathione lyase